MGDDTISSPQGHRYATAVGAIAPLFWAFGPLFAVNLKTLPPFETLSILFALGFLVSAIRITARKRWKRTWQPPIVWVAGIVGVGGAQCCYILAFKAAPPEQVELINYLWPALVIAFLGVVPRERTSRVHIAAAVIAFCGVALLLGGNRSFSMTTLHGYLFALMAAVCWAGYTLFSRHNKGITAEMIGLYFGVMALVCLIIHRFTGEMTLFPSPIQIKALLCMGVGSLGFSFTCWEHGIKKGNIAALGLVAYLVPVLSIALLIAYNMAQPSLRLLGAAALIAVGNALPSFIRKSSAELAVEER